jgi:hypothetical protein
MVSPPNATKFFTTAPFSRKPGNFRSETLRLVQGIEATENQTLKIGVAWPPVSAVVTDILEEEAMEGVIFYCSARVRASLLAMSAA